MTRSMFHPEWDAAWQIAKHEVPDLSPFELHRFIDCWGGYWQCRTHTPRQPYTFRATSQRW